VIHAALDRPGTPATGQAPRHRVQVALQSGGEGAQAGQFVGPDGSDPGWQVLAAEPGEHLAEGPDVVGSRPQLRAPLEDRLQLQVLVVGEAVGMAGEPAGHLPDGRRRWGDGAGHPPIGLQVVTDQAVAARKAQGGDLLVQLDGVDAALLDALLEVGLERIQLAGAVALPLAVDQLLPALGAGIALHGVASPAQLPRDRADAVALGEQVVDERVGLKARSANRPTGWTSAGSGPDLWRCCGCGPAGGGRRAAPWVVEVNGGRWFRLGPGSGSGRQARWRATQRSTALPRFCHRWNRSATCTASGAPRRTPSA